MTKLCVVTGCPNLAMTGGSRCAHHRAQQRAKYTGAWPAISKAAIKAHVRVHGWQCPGWKRRPHADRDLTVDHDVGVLCRSCNSRKQATGNG